MIQVDDCGKCSGYVRVYILRFDDNGQPIDEDAHPYWSGGGADDYREECDQCGGYGHDLSRSQLRRLRAMRSPET